MKKIILILSLFSFLVCDGVSGVTYFKHADGTFSLSRVYFTYKKTISDNVSFKFQTDVGRSIITGDDGLYKAFLKKAQLDWITDENVKVSMGLIGMNMFNIQEKTWGNRFIMKSALDQFGAVPSADLGVGFTKEFDNSVTVSLFATNGEGYKASSSTINNQSRYSMQIVTGEKRLDKNYGNNFGLVFSKVRTGFTQLHWDEEIKGLFAGFSNKDVRAGAEYYRANWSSDDPSYNSSFKINSLYANYEVNENTTAFIRLDESDWSGAFISSLDKSRITGFIYNIADGLSVSPNYVETERKEYDAQGANTSTTDTDQFNLNFQFKF